MVGGGDDYRPAEGCPVAMEKFGHGEYLAHRGSPDSFLVALASVKDGSAAVRIALWKCVFCGMTLVGLGVPDGELGHQDFTWLMQGG